MDSSGFWKGIDSCKNYNDPVQLHEKIKILEAENLSLKRGLEIEQRAHEITIENCITSEDEDAGEISAENIKLHLLGVRRLAEIEIGER